MVPHSRVQPRNPAAQTTQALSAFVSNHTRRLSEVLGVESLSFVGLSRTGTLPVRQGYQRINTMLASAAGLPAAAQPAPHVPVASTGAAAVFRRDRFLGQVRRA